MEHRYVLKTLGCKANLYDSQQIESELRSRGWLPAIEGEESLAELCIVNSCTVTDDADRQSRKMATRLSREAPSAKIVLTGCAAEVDPESMGRTKGVHLVVGNRDKPKLLDLVLEAAAQVTDAGAQLLGTATGYEQMLSRHPIDREWPATESAMNAPVTGVESSITHRTRAFLKIQDGCNSFCTYCIIPYGRGPSRSLPMAEVVSQVWKLVQEGVREVVITGINIGEYGVDGSDGSPQLAALFQAILSETRLERLRVSSLDPREIDDELLALMRREPRFCPHFHVSLQSPHGRILRLMKRKYGEQDVVECLEKIARIPASVGGAFVGMDVITGFPGETSEEFEWGVQRLKTLSWSRLHVFPYSERSGTPATRLPHSVPQAERVRRAKVLRELSLNRMTELHQRVLGTGETVSGVLLESRIPGPDGSGLWYAGYSPNYLRVLVRVPSDESSANWSNRRVDVRPKDVLVERNAGDVALISKIV